MSHTITLFEKKKVNALGKISADQSVARILHRGGGGGQRRGVTTVKCLVWKCWKARKPFDRIGQHCYMILFCISCVNHH